MEKSPQNMLQEIYQKMGGKTPWYITEPARLTATPLWKSSVVLPDTGEYISGDMSARKVVAESSAAIKALSIIEERNRAAAEKRGEIRGQNMEKILEVVLIDIESIPKSLTIEPIPKVLMIGFISNQSPLKQKIGRASYDIKIVTSSVPDAADHLLSFNAGKIAVNISERKNKVRFWIATSDHMGDAVVSCLTEDGWSAHRLTNNLELDRIISGFKDKYS